MSMKGASKGGKSAKGGKNGILSGDNAVPLGGKPGGKTPAKAPAAPSAKTPTPEDIERNQAILDALLPCVAAKIDGNGGVLAIADICAMQDIKDQLAQIPACFPKALPQILSQWADFFVMMPHGLVGTAIGYDTGLIQQDGTLDPAFESTFLPNGKSAHVAAPHAAPTVYQAIPTNEPIDLAEAASELSRLCYVLEDDDACFKAFQKVRIARQQARGDSRPKSTAASLVTGISAGLTRLEKRREILTRTFEKLNASPDKSIMMNMISQDQFIRELKNGAVTSFKKWFESFPENFIITAVEGTTELKITMLSDTMPHLSEYDPAAGSNNKKPRRW